MKLFSRPRSRGCEPIKELRLVFDPGGALVFRGEGFLVGRFGEAAALQENGGAVTRRENEPPEGLMDAPHPGEAVAFVKSGLAVIGGVRGDAGFTDAIDLGEGGTDHDGGVHAPPEGVDAFGITGAEDEEEGVLCKES